MGIETVERVARIVGVAAVSYAWVEAGLGIASAHRRALGASSGLASRFGLMPAYLLVAVPYFTVCAVLWRPISIELDTAWRIALMIAGLCIGLAGVGLYVWGRRSLDSMYNVTGTFGAQVFRAHYLVASGPYRLVRHPMYLGIVIGAVGGLLLYRTWTFVFVLAAAPGMLLRARAEERLLREQLGTPYATYRSTTGMFLPRLRRRQWGPSPLAPPRPSGLGETMTRIRLLEPNSTITGRLVRGLIVAPGLGLIAFLTDWPMPLRAAAVVLLVLSVVSAITGHCFLYDLMWWRDDRRQH